MDNAFTTVAGNTEMVSSTGLLCLWNRFLGMFQAGRGFVICLVAICVFFVVAIVFWWKRRVEDKGEQQAPKQEEKPVDAGAGGPSGEERRGSSPSQYRFRKRDKVKYAAKKLLRKVTSLGRGTGNGGIGRKMKPSVIKFAAQWLSRTKEKQALRPLRGPPSTFFEADTGGEDAGTFPPEIFYMLKNIRVFGHFETPCFLELCRHVTEISVPSGQYLFKPGDSDDSIYVVQNGHVSVFIKDNDQEYEVKKVGPGESILSLLSILDVLTGHASPFKTVAAKANQDSTILKLSGSAFNDFFERYPESWVRTIQIIALRLQRVTFTTLHHYLGLSTELTKPTLRDIGPKRGRLPSGNTTESKPHERGGSFSSRVLRFALGGVTSIDQPSSDAPSDPKHAPTTPVLSPAQDTSPTKEPIPPVGGTPVLPPSRVGVGQNHAATEQEHFKKLAKDQLTELLGLTADPGLLEGKIIVQTLAPGHTLVEQGSEDVDLVYVLTGALELTQKSFDDGKPTVAAIVLSHEIVGGLAMITGEPSFYTVKTRQQSRVATISKEVFYQLMRERPRVVLNVAHTVVMRLSPFIRSIDFALDWEMCDAGKALYNQGDPSDSLYVVLSGRLRSVSKKSETVKQLMGEYGRGDLVGLVEVLTSRPRATTAISVRYTELSKLPSGLLNYIKTKYPQVLTRIIHLLGQCILGQQEEKLTPTLYGGAGCSVDSTVPHVANLNTIAVAAVSDDVPLGPFTLELMHALKSIKPTLLLSRDVIERDLGPTALLPVNEYRLFSWLSQQEDAYPVVLYQCDSGLTAWSKRCIRQADCVLIVANGDSKPTVGPLEELFDRLGVRAQKNLVLLWSENTERPVNTQEWLDVCGWVLSHYHIRAPHRMYVHARRDPRKVAEYYEERIAKQKVDHMSDFARLARTLTGHAIGLVLGGGGARGAAHLGILRALKENNVPIDFVGGVSIGSFVGGIYCSDPDIVRVTQSAREWFMDMCGYMQYVVELTYPHCAMFTGAGFNRALQNILKDRLIEDLWIPYFNITTDITASEMRIHRNGHLWRYCRASMSIAGVMPPMCDPVDGHYLVDGCYVNNVPGPLWRYCRASMSLAGYFPPICDPVDGHQLLDGGYVNNLPADVMRSMGVGEILAVDVGSQDETNLTNYGDSLSGFWVIAQRWNPWAKPIKVLNMAEIQSRLAYVSCVRQLELVKKAPYCYYIRPPIDKYQTLDFALFDEICNVGLQYGKTLLHEWSTEGKLMEILHGKNAACQDDRFKDGLPCNTYQSPQTFTDLAAYVSKIQPKTQFPLVCDFSDEDTDEYENHEENENHGENQAENQG